MEANSREIFKLNMGEIAKKIGIPLNQNMFKEVYNYNPETLSRIDEFESTLQAGRDYKTEDIENILEEFDEIFDKDLYAFMMAIALQDEINWIREKNILGERYSHRPIVYPGRDAAQSAINSDTGLRRSLINAKDLLRGSDVALSCVEQSSSDGKPSKIIIRFSKDFSPENLDKEQNKAQKRKREASKRYKEIDSKVGMDKIIEHITSEELVGAALYENIGIDFAAISRNEPEKIKNIISGYPECFDLDKLMLYSVALFYGKHGNDFEDFTQEEVDALKELCDNVYSIIPKKYDNKAKRQVADVQVESEKFTGPVTLEMMRERVTKLSKSFINGVYHSPLQIEDLAKDIIYGTGDLSSVNPNEFSDTLGITPNEVRIMLKIRPELFRQLVEGGYLEKDLEEAIIEEKASFTDDEVQYLVESKKLSKEYAVNKYFNGIISLNNMDRVKSISENDALLPLVSGDRLVELYMNKEKPEDFMRYRDLYKLIVIDENNLEKTRREEIVTNEEMSEEEKQEELTRLNLEIKQRRLEHDEKLLEEFSELLDEDTMYDFYKSGLLQVETIVGYIGKEAITTLLKSGNLRPQDVRKLYDDDEISMDTLKSVMKDPEMTETEKLVFAYSTFSDEGEEDLAAELIGELKGRTKEVESQATGITRGQGTGKSSNENPSDPCARWNLMKRIDPEYSQEFLKDGNIVFYIPSERKYVIERLYKSGNIPAYGAATYIVDEEFYRTHSDDIIKNKRFNRSYLTRLYKTVQGVDRIVHVGWGNEMIREFNLDDPTRRTPEEIEKIRELAERIERSKNRNNHEDGQNPNAGEAPQNITQDDELTME